ncbi:MAG TPA: hypothetical protein VM120_20180 [Bryobacteraceae bacterium]|nr:hypothetical protein [Bryobacteraceae bacterium]
MSPSIVSQLWAVTRLEIRKSFFSRRNLWIYLLAIVPVLIFGGHSLERSHDRERRQRMAAKNPGVTLQKLRQVELEMPRERVIEILGEPAENRVFKNRRRDQERKEEMLRYSDGNAELTVWLRENQVRRRNLREGCSFQDDTAIFATVFQFFYLRLALFFGCVFVFINLFRGEMLDKSLHYYFLAPVRREVVVGGKYLAGLIACALIFMLSTAGQLLVLNLHFDSNVLEQYLTQGNGWHHAFSYLGVTALAVVGYGSVFLTGGILLRNPLVPAAVMLLWESVNGILPSMLRKFSVIYYLKILCPVDIPIQRGVPPPLAMLALNVDPVAPVVAVLGILALAGGLLTLAAQRARRLEINYGAE